jgi:hypothetical protein
MTHHQQTTRTRYSSALTRGWRVSAVVIALSWAADSFAQPPGVGTGPGITRPTTSPYLNLLRNRNGGGGSPALNYYGLVRPQQDLRNYSARLNQQVTGLRRDVTSLQAGLLPDGSRPLSTSGHVTSFQNLGGYFPGSQGGQGTGVRR